MANDKILNEELPEEQAGIYTLVDEDGNESEFEVIGEHEMDGVVYYALIPVAEESDEYVILKLAEDEDGEECLVSVDDDDEFEKIAEIFDDELFEEVDYDN